MAIHYLDFPFRRGMRSMSLAKLGRAFVMTSSATRLGRIVYVRHIG